MLSHLFGRQNLFRERESIFQDFIIPALDQETYKRVPGLEMFILKGFPCTEDYSWRESIFQDFIIPALEQETYGEFQVWGPGLEMFILKGFPCTEDYSWIDEVADIFYEDCWRRSREEKMRFEEKGRKVLKLLGMI
ncbi:unnamed protein product [Larinioides sclopetarius]|uniref:Uncharacterized protein n=1 Tax=Larinioides sclopetarius TaxID=280406 RepID=A0AAV1YSK3_9ARAC